MSFRLTKTLLSLILRLDFKKQVKQVNPQQRVLAIRLIQFLAANLDFTACALLSDTVVSGSSETWI